MADQGSLCECGRRWTGYRECHCRSCHRHFAGLTAFDAHLKDIKFGGIEHVDPPAKAGYKLIERASGLVWGQEMDEQTLNTLRKSGKRDSDGTGGNP